MTKFRDILQEFSQEGIEFIIIGGLAARIHGSCYTTDDLDLCYARTPGNLERIAKWLQRHNAALRGASPGLPFIPDVPTLQCGLNFAFSTDVGDIDFLGEVQPVGFYADIIKHSLYVDVYGIQCRVVDIDTLILIKKKIARSKDIPVALELEAIKELQRNKDV